MKHNLESVAFIALMAGAALTGGKRKREAPVAIHSEPLDEGVLVASILHTGASQTSRLRDNVTPLFDAFGLPNRRENDIPLG